MSVYGSSLAAAVFRLVAAAWVVGYRITPGGCVLPREGFAPPFPLAEVLIDRLEEVLALLESNDDPPAELAVDALDAARELVASEFDRCAGEGSNWDLAIGFGRDRKRREWLQVRHGVRSMRALFRGEAPPQPDDLGGMKVIGVWQGIEPEDGGCGWCGAVAWTAPRGGIVKCSVCGEAKPD